MDPECQSLLALFARYFPQAHITLIKSTHQYLLNLFIASERITHVIALSCAHLPSMTQLSDWIDAVGIVELIELSPSALCLDIKEEMGHFSFSKKAVTIT